MNKGTTKMLLGFLAGAATGTLAGILIAPDKGSKTRKKIKKQVVKTKKGVSKSVGKKADYFKGKINDAVDELYSKAEAIEDNIKGKMNPKP